MQLNRLLRETIRNEWSYADDRDPIDVVTITNSTGTEHPHAAAGDVIVDDGVSCVVYRVKEDGIKRIWAN